MFSVNSVSGGAEEGAERGSAEDIGRRRGCEQVCGIGLRRVNRDYFRTLMSIRY